MFDLDSREKRRRRGGCGCRRGASAMLLFEDVPGSVVLTDFSTIMQTNPGEMMSNFELCLRGADKYSMREHIIYKKTPRNGILPGV